MISVDVLAYPNMLTCKGPRSCFPDRHWPTIMQIGWMRQLSTTSVQVWGPSSRASSGKVSIWPSGKPFTSRTSSQQIRTSRWPNVFIMVCLDRAWLDSLINQGFKYHLLIVTRLLETLLGRPNLSKSWSIVRQYCWTFGVSFSIYRWMHLRILREADNIDATKFDRRLFCLVRKARLALVVLEHLVPDDCVRTEPVAVARQWELDVNSLIVLPKPRCKWRQPWWDEMNCVMQKNERSILIF